MWMLVSPRARSHETNAGSRRSNAFSNSLRPSPASVPADVTSACFCWLDHFFEGPLYLVGVERSPPNFLEPASYDPLGGEPDMMTGIGTSVRA